MTNKNAFCPETLSGKHEFEEEVLPKGKWGHWKVEINKPLFGFIPNGLTRTYVPMNIKYVGTGEFYCKHCGIYDDTRSKK